MTNNTQEETTNEIDFASLTGFEPDIPDPVTSFDERSDPDRHRTERNIVNSPFSKIFLVGGIASVVFVLFGLFMSGIMSSPIPKSNPKSTDPTAALASAPDPKDATISQFKTDLALGSQLSAQSLKTPASNSSKPDPKLKNNLPTSPVTPAIATANLASRPPIASPPIVASPVRATNYPQPVSSNLRSPPITSYNPPTMLRVTPTVPNLSANQPLEEWQRLAKVGSYGNIAAVETPKAIAPNPPTPNLKTVASNLTPPSPANSLTNYLAQATKELPTSLPPNTLLIGTTAKAALKTPVVFSTDRNPASALIPKFIVTLQEPMKTVDGKVAIPANALLIATARPLDSKSGLSELDVVSIVIDGQELTPPLNAITIRGAEGSPLVADKYFDRGAEIASGDVGSFFTSALAAVGQLANRPTSTSSVLTVGGSSTVTSSPPPDYFGAAVGAGFENLSQSLTKRNQQLIDEIKTRPNLFFIPSGKELQVFINQTVTF